MPILGTGYELYIRRLRTQTLKKPGDTRVRTIGEYQIFHDGIAVPHLTGTIAEQEGPSDNTKDGNTFDRRVEGGRYPLWTQDGTKYKTIKYDNSEKAKTSLSVKPQPGIELIGTGKRSEILIHPAVGFLSSEGCIHPCGDLPTADTRINFSDSRQRVIAIIDDMRAYVDAAFPKVNGRVIPNAWCVIDDL